MTYLYYIRSHENDISALENRVLVSNDIHDLSNI